MITFTFCNSQSGHIFSPGPPISHNSVSSIRPRPGWPPATQQPLAEAPPSPQLVNRPPPYSPVSGMNGELLCTLNGIDSPQGKGYLRQQQLQGKQLVISSFDPIRSHPAAADPQKIHRRLSSRCRSFLELYESYGTLRPAVNIGCSGGFNLLCNKQPCIIHYTMLQQQ